MSNFIVNMLNESEICVDDAPLQRCADVICDHEGLFSEGEINLLICSDAQMRTYNRLYRGVDNITDVLCFVSPGDLPGNADKGIRLLLCDIIIDINQLDRQKEQNTLNKELMDIFIHGLLHAFGYDHIRQQDYKLMTDKEIYYQRIMEDGNVNG